MNRGGNGGRTPWDKGEEGLPPEIEKILKNITKGFKGGSLNILFMIIAIVGIWIAFSCAYTVGVDEEGVIQRFGKFTRTATPGLHFKLPWGIENLTKVKVKYVYTEEFGFRTLRAGIKSEFASGKQYEREYLMLTGDLNCAVVPWIIQFRIDDSYQFLFKIRDVRATLRDMSESIMRQIVGDRSINEVISKRKEIADEVKIRLQQVLSESQTGIKLVNVELKKTNVPEPVQSSFNEVNQAVQEKERLIYQAREEYNKIIPKARGEAEQTIKQSEGYALDRVNRAKGDASRFLSLWKEYASAKDVTRRRLYLEAMGIVLPKMGNKYIIDPDQKGLLPLLNLERGGQEK